jgi:hypothetical protein
VPVKDLWAVVPVTGPWACDAYEVRGLCSSARLPPASGQSRFSP